MKTLIMLSAIPAAGKSTWARKYRDEHPEVYIISSDEIRMELTGGNYHDRTKMDLVWQTFDRRIHEYAQKSENATVILDALNDTNEIRLKYLKMTPEYDKKILVIFPPLDLERSKKLNAARDASVRVPDHIMDMFAKKYEQPSKEVLDLIDELIDQ
jgi:predicted kinase